MYNVSLFGIITKFSYKLAKYVFISYYISNIDKLKGIQPTTSHETIDFVYKSMISVFDKMSC